MYLHSCKSNSFKTQRKCVFCSVSYSLDAKHNPTEFNNSNRNLSKHSIQSDSFEILIKIFLIEITQVPSPSSDFVKSPKENNNKKLFRTFNNKKQQISRRTYAN